MAVEVKKWKNDIESIRNAAMLITGTAGDYVKATIDAIEENIQIIDQYMIQ